MPIYHKSVSKFPSTDLTNLITPVGGATVALQLGGQLRVADGLTSAPGIAFAGGDRHGFFRSGLTTRWAQGGNDLGTLDSNGNIQLNYGNYFMGLSAAVIWGLSGSDLYLRRDGPGILALKNGANPHKIQIYQIEVDTLNYSRLQVGYETSTFDLSSSAAGSGVEQGIRIMAGANGGRIDLLPDGSISFTRQNVDIRWKIDGNGHLITPTDNTYSIGAFGATRPANGYFGTSINVGTAVAASASLIRLDGDFNTLAYRQQGVEKWEIYQNSGDSNLYFRDIVNAKTLLTMSPGANPVLAINDGSNIVLGATTGTQIGTTGGAAGQKLGFYGAPAIVQPLLATGAAHTVDDVIGVLQTIGLLRQA